MSSVFIEILNQFNEINEDMVWAPVQALDPGLESTRLFQSLIGEKFITVLSTQA